MGAALRQSDDGLGTQVMCSEQRTHGNGLIDAGELLTDKIRFNFESFAPFCGMADLGHFNDSLQWVFA